MNTFGHLVMHIVQSNNLLCSKISGAAAPDAKLADSDGKEKLVAGLKASFEFCSTALANVDDSKLSESMILFGNRPASRDRKSTRLNSSHQIISYAVFCLKKKKKHKRRRRQILQSDRY